jgi:hypothetical protein
MREHPQVAAGGALFGYRLVAGHRHTVS